MLLALDNPIQSYAWGSRTALASLMGRTATGQPEAELWIGAHPRAPSRLQDGRSLYDVIQADRTATLGVSVEAEFSGELPFLLKVLAVETPLSLQAHPNLEQAREGFAREQAAHVPLGAPERNYKDPNHKPELLCALGPFEALCGFRPPREAAEVLATLGVAGSVVERLGSAHPAPLRAAFGDLMALDLEAKSALLTTLAERAANAHDDPRFGSSYRWASRLLELYPEDIGALMSLLLNHVALRPLEAIYLEAGCLHAYLQGVAVEIMANSDNVLRGGLTPKHVDVGELSRVLRFEEQRIVPTSGAGGPAGGERASGCEVRYPAPAREFALSRIELGEAPFETAATGPELLLCTRGAALISAGPSAPEATPSAAAAGLASSLRLRRGASCFVPATLGRYTVSGQGQVFRARVGRAD